MPWLVYFVLCPRLRLGIQWVQQIHSLSPNLSCTFESNSWFLIHACMLRFSAQTLSSNLNNLIYAGPSGNSCWLTTRQISFPRSSFPPFVNNCKYIAQWLVVTLDRNVHQPEKNGNFLNVSCITDLHHSQPLWTLNKEKALVVALDYHFVFRISEIKLT
jgi:hypothetical protein